MKKGRLEAFSDGVIAIIITIMVLEMKAPAGTDLAALKPLVPAFLSYVLSFVFLGIYWNNHHHLLQTVENVNGQILWANSHLLFWLSLVPFVTRWMGESHFVALPVALYGIDMLCAAVAYFILTQAIIAHHGKSSVLSKAVGSEFKGKVSIGIYAAAVMLSFVNALYACALYALVAIMWLIPDRRIEKNLARTGKV